MKPIVPETGVDRVSSACIVGALTLPYTGIHSGQKRFLASLAHLLGAE